MASFKILDNPNDITKGFTQLLYNAVNHLDGFGITDGSPLLLESEVIHGCIRNLRNLGKRVRYITNIENANIESCKKILEIVELRHLDNIQGGIIINDFEYLSLLESKNDDPNSSPIHIYSKNKWLVEQQKLIFDMLWEKAIPARIRIKQIEQGLERDVCELITDENAIMIKYEQALNSLTKELCIFYSVSDDGVSNEQIGQKISEIINHVSKSKSKDIKIIVIVLTNNSVERKAPLTEFSQIRQDYDIRIKYMNKESANSQLPRDLMILTVDRKELFISEIRGFEEISHSIFENDISFTIHSNSGSVVSTYNTILGMLWSQDELYKKSEMAITQLKLQDKLQKEFVHNFANGLRNPIQPILGFSEILLEKKEDFNKYRDILDIINACAQKLAKHVNNMIDITEIENETFLLNKETFDLMKVIREITKQLKKNILSITKKNFSISTTDDRLMIYADKNRVKFTIENVIINAVDIPDSNNIKIFVEKTRSSSSQYDDKNEDVVILSVVDDGTGIDGMILPSLFSKFVADSRDGLGLGLYLAKSIIDRHGGEMWAENNKNGKGATIRFSLPIS
ncbi:sensor histidine kinase [Candidatus Nitrosocosmicus arcticus]|uniref:histidine kinase n=1 Tax=Candidatus Nitrosocosmicus arcticus TaxID=2035267 RepID=A0A557SU82_9ARCH|nr:HAMP domain-containing sensor histidine kinase [Candidatus Nitrosocosmicus arcticus]TVP40160.1 putative signal transduction histidine kinase with phosphoacceptor and ATP binding domain [Candidatus Nitrosocosmicus arcticus]